MNNSFANLQKNDLPVENSLFDELFVSIWPKATVHNGTPPAKVTTLAEFLHELPAQDANMSRRILQKFEEQNGKTIPYKKWRSANVNCFAVGKWEGRNILEQVSPCVVAEVDSIGKQDLHSWLKRVAALPYVIAAWPSTSRTGVHFLVFTNANEFERGIGYRHVCEQISKDLDIPVKYDAPIDTVHIDYGTNGEQPGQLWFFAYVPKDLLSINEDPQELIVEPPKQAESQTSTVLPPAPITPSKTTGRGKQYNFDHSTRDQVLNLVEQIEARRLDLTPGKTGAWFKIGLALFDGFGDHEGLELFHRVSRFYPGYTQEETEQQWQEVKKKANGSVRIDTFFEICKQAGILVDHSSIAAGKRAANRVQRPKPGPKPVQRKEEHVVVDGVEEVEEEQDPFDDLPMPDPKGALRLDKENCCYRWVTQNKNDSGATETRKDRISNFIIRPIYHLFDSENSKRLWELKNVHGDRAMLAIPVKVLSKPSELNALIENQGNFVAGWRPSQFVRIKEYLYSIECKAKEISVMGMQPDTGHWAFANGILKSTGEFIEVNETGIVDVDGVFYFIPAFSNSIPNVELAYENERKFIFRPSDVDFNYWSASVLKVFKDKGKIGIAFLVASIFQDIVAKNLDLFPELFLFGIPQSGKSTYRNSFKNVFGAYEMGDSTSLGGASTTKAFNRKLSQMRNTIQVFEEYKNNIDKSHIEMLKSAYDRIGYDTAHFSNDSRTRSTSVLSSIIVSGQEMPTYDPALFTRVILQTFEKTGYSPEEIRDYQQHKELITQGLGNVFREIFVHRGKVVEQFNVEALNVEKRIKDDPQLSDIDTRMVNNMKALLVPSKIILDKLNSNLTFDDLYSVLKTSMVEQNEMMGKSSDLNQFWRIFDYLVGQGEITSMSYKLDLADGLIYIRLEEIHPKYVLQSQKQRTHYLDSQSLEKYLTTQKGFQKTTKGEKTHSIRFDSTTLSGKTKRALCFQLKFLNLENIYNSVTKEEKESK